jgi:hypothetical protein
VLRGATTKSTRRLPHFAQTASADDIALECFSESGSLACGLKINPTHHAGGVHAPVLKYVRLKSLLVEPLPHFRHAGGNLAAVEPDLHGVQHGLLPFSLMVSDRR